MNYLSASGIRPYTTKQMSDACEMLVAAELTLAGVPALKAPDNWPHYDVIAQPRERAQPVRISVKARTFSNKSAYLEYKETDEFDWLAMVILKCPEAQSRRIFIVPRDLCDSNARHDAPTAKTAHLRYWRINEISRVFLEFENNFTLSRPA
ncbi:hypothetical protein [Roseixanthobacter liquoris]|uniref:hypothetical protein n=1 Tax=Roseixanthobacter liquoris TaxID=3119921 RepID=UPI0037266627